MRRKYLIPVYSRAEAPHFANDEECARFWGTHEAAAELAGEEQRERERLGLPCRSRRGLAQPPVVREETR
jgi:hypothetical protein